VQIPTKYKIPTIYYVNIRPNRHSEIPKSKATYSRAANTKQFFRYKKKGTITPKTQHNISVSAITFNGYT
jgi:hypothetical protein